ncbi:MAG: hypothetical protein ACI923_001843 [Flavobacteriales bacterium]|jgi:hypothetical protein
MAGMRVVLLILSIIRLATADFSNMTNFTGIFEVVEPLIWVVLAVFLTIQKAKKAKELSGSFVAFHETGVDLVSRKKEGSFDTKTSKLNSVFSLKEIEVSADS